MGIFQHFCRKISKNWKGDPLVSPGIVCYAKNGNFFWFSSLGQMVQFDAKKLRRTSKSYFGQFVWLEKNATSIFHFMKRPPRKTRPSEKTLGTLAKILHILTYSRLLLKLLIRSCLFLLHTNLLNFLIVFLVRVLSRVSRVVKRTSILFTSILLLFALPATLSFFEVLNIGQHEVVNFRT